MKSKKFLYALLILIMIMLFPLAISCAEKKENDAAPDGEGITTTENATETGTTEEPKINPGLPEKDYKNAQYKFLLKGDTFNEWASFDIASEGETGDVINDAIFRRNAYVEDTYKIDITWDRVADVPGIFRKSFKAGDNAFDVVMPDLPSAAKIAQEGMFGDLNRTEYIDLSKPWWDAQGVKEFTVNNKLYFCTSDLSFNAIDTIWTMMFNKTMIKDLGLEDPYAVVKRGDWTFDKLNEMIKDVSRDTTGDGTITEQDFAGFVTPSDRYVRAMLLAAGCSFTEKTEDDYFAFKQPDSKFLEVYDRAIALMHGNPDVLDINDIKDQGSSYLTNKYFLAKNMFGEGRLLFFSEVMQNIFRLRQLDCEFGVIPLPKYTKEQNFTPHYVFVDATICTAIPSNPADPERTAVILEAMTAESKYTSIKAYYDVALKTKLTRDDQSSEMIDIIRTSRTYDLASVYDFGGIYGTLSSTIMANKNGYQTMLEKQQGKINTGIEKIVNKYKELD